MSPTDDAVLPEGKDAEAILKEARERLNLSIDAEDANRKEALDDLRFLAGEQWDSAALKARKDRPCLTINRLPTFVRQVVNEQRKTRPAIDVIPGDAKASKATADVLQGLIRQIERTSRAQIAYDTSFEQNVSCSFGHFRVKTAYIDDESFDQELQIERIENPFSVYRDPASIQPDHSDDRFTFVSSWVDAEEFEERWGFKPTSREEAGTGDDTIPQWFDGDRVRVAEYWRVETEEVTLNALSSGKTVSGKLAKAQIDELASLGDAVINSRVVERRRVEQYIVTWDRVIKMKSWPGRYIPILTSQGAELNVDGQRKLFSLIRFAKDPQRMVNYWASAETEAMALQPKAPIVGAVGAFDTRQGDWAKASSENFAYLEYDPVPGEPPPQRQPPPIFPQGLREGRIAAGQDMQSVIGIYDASLGAQSNETSGVAIRQRQQEGDISTFNFIDNHARAIEQCGRVLIDLIPYIYDAPRTIRILGTDNQEQLAVINQLFIDPLTGREQMHDLKLGKYDVAVRVGPSFESQRQEMVQAMVELSNANPQLMQLAGDIVVKNMDWPQSQEIADRLQQAMAAQAGKPPPEQALVEAQVNVEQIKAQAAQARASADAQIKQMELQIAQQEFQIKQQEVRLAELEVQQKAQESGQKAQLDSAALVVEREKVGVEMAKTMNERLQLHASMLPRDPVSGAPLPMPEGMPMPSLQHDQAVQTMTALAVEIGNLIKVLAAPRKTQLLTGPDGKPIGSVSQSVVAPSPPTVQ